jgi:AAA domain
MADTTSGTEKKGIILPTTVQKAKSINPKTIVIYGKPKTGKTTALSKLPSCLIIDVEAGSAFIDGMIVQPPENAGPVARFKWLKELAATIKEAGKPYDYVAIDTLSQLDIDAEWVGTYNYMNSITGKKFNRDSEGKVIKPSDPNYESVLTLGNGYGYRYTREAIMDIFDTLKDLGKICTIFVCHVADKMISNKSGEEIMIKDLALVGKTRDVIPRLCDAIAHVWNEDGKLMISFIGDNQKIGGVRAKHLLGYNDVLDWDSIFIKEK